MDWLLMKSQTLFMQLKQQYAVEAANSFDTLRTVYPDTEVIGNKLIYYVKINEQYVAASVTLTDKKDEVAVAVIPYF